MKLTVNKLRQIIREEVEKATNEAWKPGDDPAMRPGVAKVGPSAGERWRKKSDKRFISPRKKKAQLQKPLNVRIAVVFDDYLQDKSMDDLKSAIEAEEETLMAALDTAGATAEGARELIRRMEKRDKDFAAGKAAYGGGDYMLKALVSRA
jgi:hypothetical protein